MKELLTRTSETPVAARRSPVTGPYLYLVLECDRISQLGARFALADASRLQVGRGSARLWSSDPLKGQRLELPDRFLSQRHADLVYEDGAWTLRDLGSKNGSFVNGAAVTEVALNDGDLIELGHCFFLFRVEPMSHGQRRATEGSALDILPGLRTLAPALEESFASLTALARASAPLVILGETGTGKEVIAKTIHELSGRPGAFVGVNCGALPALLVESELFGSKKGAFSGATEDRVGLVRSADRGTLLLDEIGDLPLEAQTVLLRTLQEGEVRPVGASRATPVDLRVLAATHRDLDALVKKGRFRADLLARLSGFTVKLPPLRERIVDFTILLGSLGQARGGTATSEFSLSVDAARAMLRYPWPMNIRELEQVLRSAIVLARAGATPGSALTVALEHLPQNVRAPRPSASASLRRPSRVEECEDERRAVLVATMEAHRGNVSAVARALGTARMQIHRWIRRYDVKPEDFRGQNPPSGDTPPSRQPYDRSTLDP